MAADAEMEDVKAFNAELQSLYDIRPPVSKAKMTDITKRAMRTVKRYKHVVHSVEKFIHKCKPEYKVPGLYVIDSIVRQSRHQFTPERDVFAPRFQKNIKSTFQALVKCPEEDRPKLVRVLNLWQKNSVFPLEITQMLHEVVAAAPLPGAVAVGQVRPKPISADSRNGGTAENAILVEDPVLASKITTMASQILKDQHCKENKPAFDRKLLDFDYGEEEEEKPPVSLTTTISSSSTTVTTVASSLIPPVGVNSAADLSSVVKGSQVEDVHKIANSVLTPNLLESIQRTLAAQGQILAPLKPVDSAPPPPPPPPPPPASEIIANLPPMVPPPPPGSAVAASMAAGPSGPAMLLHPNPFGMPVMIANPFVATATIPPPPPPGPAVVPPTSVPSGMLDTDIRLQPPQTQQTQQQPQQHLSGTSQSSSGKDEDLRQRSMVASVAVDEEPPLPPSSSSASSSRHRRRSSRSPGSRRRSRSRSGNRSSRRRDRSRDRGRRADRSTSADRERERERLSKGLPPLRKGFVTLCSNTLWLGHVSKATTESDLEASFGESGKILSIDVIPPRGCAYVCMDRRQDAYRTLLNKRNIRLKGSSSRIKIAWAPHKGTKNHKDLKDFWDVDQGCFFIPEDRLISSSMDLAELEDGGMFDLDSMSDEMRRRFETGKSDDDVNQAQPPLPPASVASSVSSVPVGVSAPVVSATGIPLPFGVPPVGTASFALSSSLTGTSVAAQPGPASATAVTSGGALIGMPNSQISPAMPASTATAAMMSMLPSAVAAAGLLARPTAPVVPPPPPAVGTAVRAPGSGAGPVPLPPPPPPMAPMSSNASSAQQGSASLSHPANSITSAPTGPPSVPHLSVQPGAATGPHFGPLQSMQSNRPMSNPPRGGPLLGSMPGTPLGGGPMSGGLPPSRGPMPPNIGMTGPRGPMSGPMGPMGPVGMGGPMVGPMGHRMPAGPRLPMRNGLEGPLESPMDMPPRFGGPPGFMGPGPRGPPPHWNGPPGGIPGWRHGPPVMRPDFRPPHLQQPGLFNGRLPPSGGGPFGNMSGSGPMSSMGGPSSLVPMPRQSPLNSTTLMPMGVPSAGSVTSEKRPADLVGSMAGDRIERKRERRSRWSDAPNDSAVSLPSDVVLDNAPGYRLGVREVQRSESSLAHDVDVMTKENSSALEQSLSGAAMRETDSFRKSSEDEPGAVDEEIVKLAHLGTDTRVKEAGPSGSTKSFDMFDDPLPEEDKAETIAAAT